MGTETHPDAWTHGHTVGVAGSAPSLSQAPKLVLIFTIYSSDRCLNPVLEPGGDPPLGGGWGLEGVSGARKSQAAPSAMSAISSPPSFPPLPGLGQEGLPLTPASAQEGGPCRRGWLEVWAGRSLGQPTEITRHCPHLPWTQVDICELCGESVRKDGAPGLVWEHRD